MTVDWDEPEDEPIPSLQTTTPRWDTEAPWAIVATHGHGRPLDNARDRGANDPSMEQHEGTNDVLIVGALGVISRRDGKDVKVVASGRNEFGAEISRLLVVIDDGIDAPYELPIELVRGMYLMHLDGQNLERGSRVMLRGRLGRRGRFDRRYIDWRDPAHVGRHYEELTVLVDAIRLAQPEEVDGSLVRLRGRVVDPPAFPRGQPGRYRHVAGAIEVTELRPSRMPGSRAQESVETLVPVEMSLATPNADGLLRRNNIVALEGRLERYRANMDADHDAVKPLLQQLQADVDLMQAQPHDGTRRDAERRLASRKLNILHPYRTRVRVGYVELLEGKPCSPEEAVRLRSEFVNARRAARARRERTAIDTALPGSASTLPPVYPTHERRVEVLAPVATDTPGTSSPGGDDEVVPKRHRKRRIVAVDERDDAPTHAGGAVPSSDGEDITVGAIAEPAPAVADHDGAPSASPVETGDGAEAHDTEHASP